MDENEELIEEGMTNEQFDAYLDLVAELIMVKRTQTAEEAAAIVRNAKINKK